MERGSGYCIHPVMEQGYGWIDVTILSYYCFSLKMEEMLHRTALFRRVGKGFPPVIGVNNFEYQSAQPPRYNQSELTWLRAGEEPNRNKQKVMRLCL